jgi:filamentous hemagglutinin
MADLSSYINIAANTVTTANLNATGNVSSNSVISTTGNITGGNVLSNGDISTTGSTNTLNLTTQNGDANPVNSKAQITFGYNGTNDYPQFIHTRHNAGSNLYNTIELWTSDGTQAGTFPANAILGLTVTNGNITTSGILTNNYYYANGTPVTFGGSGTYGNSNVNTLLASWGSNTISTTGNINVGYLFGNGSQLTGLPATYGNSNVTVLLGNLGSNTISGTGNITTTANISGGYILGNGSQLTGIAANYGNANVATFLAAFGSNTVSTTGTVYAGNTSTSGNATIGTALVIVGSTNTLQTTNGSAVQFANRVNFNQTGTSIVASGNISGANILGSVLSASGNITGGNVITGGLISATGAILGSGILSISGNVTGANLTLSAIAVANNFIANVTTITSSASNVTLTAASTFSQYINGSASQYIILPNATTLTTGAIYAFNNNSSQPTYICYNDGTLQFTVPGGGYVEVILVTNSTTNGTWDRCSFIPSYASWGSSTLAMGGANISGANNISTTGSVSSVGNVTGGNILTAGIISSTGNAIHGNILTTGLISAAGNIFSTNIISANVFSASGNIYSSGTISTTYTPVTTSGYGILSQGANTTGGTGYYDFLKATNQSGNATNPGKSFRINSTGAFEIINSAYSQTIFSLTDSGNLTVPGTLVVSGNANVQGTLTYNNTTTITTSNLVLGLGNTQTGTNVTGAGIVVGNTNQASLLYSYSGNNWTSNIAFYATGNITTGGYLSAVGNVSGSYIIGNGSQLTGLPAGYANSNAASFLSAFGSNTISTTGSITSGNITGGNLVTGGIISATGNITGGNISATSHTGTTVSVSGIVTGASVVGGVITGTSTSVSGNVTGGNVLTGGVISSTGNITGSSLLGTTVSASGTVTAASVVGGVMTGASTSVSGNVTGGNVLTGGIISATGNIYGGNIINAGISSVTGNLSAGNVLTGGIISATATITGGNIATAGTASATGNITGGNILSAGLISTTGNAIHGNVSTAGLITATGNITGGNVLTAGQVSATGNITGNMANVTTLFAGTAVANLYNTAALNAVGNSAGNTISGLNVINLGGGAGSGSGIDFYTYTGNSQYGPGARIFGYDTGNYSANLQFATKINGAGNNALSTNMVLSGNSLYVGGTTGTGNVYTGNVIVNGQPTTYGYVNPGYVNVGLTNTITGIGGGSTLIYDTVLKNNGTAVTYNTGTGVFTLTAGVTYNLMATGSWITFSDTSGGYIVYSWVDATTNTRLDTTGDSDGIAEPLNRPVNEFGATAAELIYTPVTNQTVKVYVVAAGGTVSLRGGTGSKAIVTQLNPSIAVQATATGTINNQYASITNNTDISISSGVAKDVTFDTVTASSGIPYSTSTGVFTLTSGVTYRFTGEISFAGYTGYALYQLVDATTNTAINGQISANPSYNSGFTEANNNTYDAIYTPSTNQTVKFRVTGSSFTGTGVIRGGYFGRINVQQINNAFALNTLATMSTTGNVSVGGNLTTTGGIRKNARVLTTTTTLTVADASGFIEFNSGPYTVTLPDPTQAANSGIGYRFWQNTTSNITLSTPAGGFYGPSGNSGASTKVLAQATTQYWDVWSDGYNWAVFGIKIA